MMNKKVLQVKMKQVILMNLMIIKIKNNKKFRSLKTKIKSKLKIKETKKRKRNNCSLKNNIKKRNKVFYKEIRKKLSKQNKIIKIWNILNKGTNSKLNKNLNIFSNNKTNYKALII